MRYTSLAIMTAALMMGGAGTAYAQMTGPGYAGDQRFIQGQGQGGQQFGQGGQQFGQGGQQFGQGQRGAAGQQQFGAAGAQRGQADRFQERAALRRELRQAGFQNIRILNAAYLVQASMPDGTTVLMMVDPPAQIAVLGASRMPGQQQMGQRGRMGQMGQTGQTGQQGSVQAQGGMSQQQAGQVTGATGQGPRMNESQVRSMLQARGLSNIENLEREGDTFTASADWQGEQVDVRVNARTGEITQPETL